jgi:hypothetical protein
MHQTNLKPTTRLLIDYFRRSEQNRQYTQCGTRKLDALGYLCSIDRHGWRRVRKAIIYREIRRIVSGRGLTVMVAIQTPSPRRTVPA